MKPWESNFSVTATTWGAAANIPHASLYTQLITFIPASLLCSSPVPHSADLETEIQKDGSKYTVNTQPRNSKTMVCNLPKFSLLCQHTISKVDEPTLTKKPDAKHAISVE